MKKNRVYFLEGGLGNQACIYAHASYMAETTQDNIEVSIIKLNTFIEKRHFELSLILKTISGVKLSNSWIHFGLYIMFKLIMKVKKLSEYEFHFFGSIYSIGYHQSNVYPKLKALNPILKLNKPDKGVLAVHIRRGDYLLNKHSAHGVISLESFLPPVVEIISDYTITSIEVISEGEEALGCFDSLGIPVRYRLGEDALVSFNRMVNAEYVVCSNSTFSLLAASLGNKTHVFVPDKWALFDGALDLANDLPKYEVNFK